MPDLPRITILGAGRVGGALAAQSPIPADLVTREAGWEALDGPAGAPVVVAVDNAGLDAALARVPAARRPDLVFVQNGVLEPWLFEHGLQDSTRALLYFAVPRRGAAIEPGGTSVLTGPHAEALATWMRAMDLPVEVVAREAFTAAMLEKLIWNSAFGLLCQRFDCSVGEVLERHDETLAALVHELLAVGRAALGVELAAAPLLQRLRAYSRAIPTYRGAVKDWRWRNGWFVAAAAEHAIATPTHLALLREAGVDMAPKT
ncbi:ketopantoate reductase family protein [Nannocystis bainbridge]|uniref:Ketopantoate reductase C-terminal domain-containing protein n=1 Tax=Nannocystis bainbridge TaxID=2995303 RepID=A0ABT5DQX4_9BACT|nr:ketopantoate reductase C-terminal domain-containing protein [Nannocystis bainbridge]MDC0715956.1 ketopantoate reductase C-terminal domain-containing protein [Nannocystis bainbridge]